MCLEEPIDALGWYLFLSLSTLLARSKRAQRDVQSLAELTPQVILRGLHGEAVASALRTCGFLVSAVEILGEHLAELILPR